MKSVKHKFIMIAFIVLVLLIALGSISYLSNVRIMNEMEISKVEMQDAILVKDLDYNLQSLLLSAMDSIIDKDEGKISGERISEMKQSSKIIIEGLIKLEQIVQIKQERELILKLKISFENLRVACEETLKELIEANASQEEFAEIDDVIDDEGALLGKEFVKLSLSFVKKSEERIEKTKQVILNWQIVSVSTFILGFLIFVFIFFRY